MQSVRTISTAVLLLMLPLAGEAAAQAAWPSSPSSAELPDDSAAVAAPSVPAKKPAAQKPVPAARAATGAPAPSAPALPVAAPFGPVSSAGPVDPARPPACLPPNMLPPSGRNLKPDALGNSDPAIQAAYLEAVRLIYCEVDRADEARGSLRELARLGYRPAIRAFITQIIDDPSVLGSEAPDFLAIFAKEAKAGSGSASNILGVMYEQGVGTEANLDEARKHYLVAAADNNQRALEWVTYAAATGRMKVDQALAQKNFVRLQRDRAARTARRIVVALEMGTEGHVDKVAARRWFDRATAADSEAATRIASEFYKVWLNGTNQNPNIDPLQVALEYNSTDAKYHIALRHLASGNADERKVAMADLREIAIAGHIPAAETLAALTVQTSDEAELGRQAEDMLRLAVNNDRPGAMLALANQIYFNELSLPKVWLASVYVRKAAELGLPEAQHRLGLLYLEGLGVERNDKEARIWLTKARDAGYELAANVLETIDATAKP